MSDKNLQKFTFVDLA